MEGGAAQLPNQQPSLEQLPEGEQAVNNKLLKPTSWAQNINRTKCDWSQTLALTQLKWSSLQIKLCLKS